MIPMLKTDNNNINMAFRLAIGDFYSNISLFCDGLLDEDKPVMLAGMGYDTPWTRDAAINTWNCGGLLAPEIAKNTLLAVVINDNGKKRIGGEYWDAIIWVTGAYHYWLFTGDEEFYELMAEVTENSLKYFEKNEFDEKLNLFRGGACYGDGISAYPDIYADGECGYIHIKDLHPELCVPTGFGIPMHTLSTNCLYFNAYTIAYKITGKLEYKDKAEKMKTAINAHFWNEEKGMYNYIVDDFGGSDAQEGLGESFAILFGIADDRQRDLMLKNVITTKHGIPCLYPVFLRYQKYGSGRHSGLVWPHIQAFWADAAKTDEKILEHEIMTLTENVIRDGYFSEIYHPETGERYGGVQEWQGQMTDTWKSEKRQMWCATGYLRMIFFDLLGMRFDIKGLYIKPNKIQNINNIRLIGFKYRNAEINIEVTGKEYNKEVFVPCDSKGKLNICI